MSQAKVDKYKEYKKNRKEILEKEKKQAKRSKVLTTLVVGVLSVAIVAGIGAKVYVSYQEALAAKPDYKATSFVLSDFAGMMEEETESEE